MRAPGLAAAAPALIMLGLVALGFQHNHALTRDLAWPAFDTQYREMAAAQTLIDQGYGPDACYRDESLWYNPISSGMAALASTASGRPLREVVPRLGPFVNLLAPLALYVLLAILAEEWAALAAAAALVFITGNAFPFWQAASYSPWFSAENYGQAFLYLSLALAVKAQNASSARRGEAPPRSSSTVPFGDASAKRPLAWHAALGAALGVTFLTHTAPALLLGTTLVLLAAQRGWRTGAWKSSAGHLALGLAIALLISAPLVWHVLGRYHLAVLNPFPSEAPETILDLNERPALLATLFLRTPFLLAAVAIPVFLRRRRGTAEGQVLLAWVAAVLLFFAYGDLCYVARKLGVSLPTVIPTFHFLFHGMALVSVGFGLAVAEAAQMIARGTARRVEVPAGLVAAVLVLGCVTLAWGPHHRRFDAAELREEAVLFPAAIPGAAYDWIRTHTESDDVFLSTDDASLYLVSPAGRKVVATNRFFSNPYVDWKARDEDRNRMFALARSGDLDGFDRLAARYRVAYVLVFDGSSAFLRKQAGMSPRIPPPLTRAEMAGRDGFEPLFAGEGITIYKRSAGFSRL